MSNINPIDDNRVVTNLENTRDIPNQDQRKIQLKKVCREFEAIFTQMLLKEMRNTIPENSFFGKSNASKIYQSMYDEALAQEISSRGSLGLAEQIYQNLSKYV